MRIWPRLITITLLLLTTSVSTVTAQMMGAPFSNAPAFMGGPAPAYSAVDTSGVPGSFPAQGISPFENAFDQVYQQDGMWFRRTLGMAESANSYVFSVQYGQTKTRGLSGRIGNPTAPTFTQQETIDGTAETLPDSVSLNNFNPGLANFTPDIHANSLIVNWGVRNPTGWGFNVDVIWNGQTDGIYNSRANYESIRLNHSDAQFLEASEGQGLVPSMFSNAQERQLVEDQILTGDITLGLANDFGRLGDADEVLDRNLHNLHAIPLNNGVFDPLQPDGFNQRFDLDYIIKHTTESFGIAPSFYLPPVYESDRFTLNPTFGGRFMQIGERFEFNGVDSGLDYDANVPDGTDDDDDFIVDNVAETGDDTFAEQNPYGTVVEPGITPQSLIRSHVRNSVQTTLAGPEAGVQYLIGSGEGFRLTGSTRVGALFNSEKSRLSGDNIADMVTTTIDLDPGSPTSGQTILQDAFNTSTANRTTTQNAFSDSKRSSHISPMFQQTVQAEIPLFSRVPVLRDMRQLENATFQAGWTYLWIGEIADPTQSIEWVSNPRAGIFPTLNTKRSNFFQNTFRVGINWEY